MGMKSLSLVHPDDRANAQVMVRNLQAGGDGGLLECRVKNAAGEFMWVEANLRPVRNSTSGTAIGILNMVRDISDRKRAELDLKRANVAFEALVVTDPLTGVANRRRFDQCLSNEWRCGCATTCLYRFLCSMSTGSSRSMTPTVIPGATVV